MNKDEALKLALEALNTPRPTDSYPPLWRSYEKTINDAITAIKQALAAPTVQDSTCRETLRAQGKAYPRTCKKCGLGPCIALANIALDKKAENARELGLDYEPVWCGHCNGSGRMVRDPDIGTDQECFVCDGAGVPAAPVQEPVAWVYSQGAAKVVSMNYVPGVRAIPLYTTPPATPDLQAELDATNRQVEILSDALAESRREVAALKAECPPCNEDCDQGRNCPARKNK
jgi:hypothetical protein